MCEVVRTDVLSKPKSNFEMFKLLMLYFMITKINAALGQQISRKQLCTLHQWTDLSLNLMGSESNLAIKVLPVDVDIEYGDNGHHRTFLTIPRLSLGIPYSLAVIADSQNGQVLNPKLQPYPSFAWHIISGNNCTGITSAIRTFIDSCWRLWVMDSGQVNSLQVCPPQILAFDLVHDILVHRFILPGQLYMPGVSIFTALTVDASDELNCNDAIAYIADAWTYGLIVYDAIAEVAWRIEHELMQPVENLEKFTSPHAGIFTVSLSPKSSLERKLYFHTLNSFDEVAVPLKIVNNGSFWQHTLRSSAFEKEFIVIGRRDIQCESEVMDHNGHLYCSLIGLNALSAWKEGTNYTADDLQAVAYNPTQFKFITGLKVNKNGAGEDELWALSSEPELFMNIKGPKWGSNAIKIQLIGCRVSNLLQNEPCTVGIMDVMDAYKSNKY